MGQGSLAGAKQSLFSLFMLIEFRFASQFHQLPMVECAYTNGRTVVFENVTLASIGSGTECLFSKQWSDLKSSILVLEFQALPKSFHATVEKAIEFEWSVCKV